LGVGRNSTSATMIGGATTSRAGEGEALGARKELEPATGGGHSVQCYPGSYTPVLHVLGRVRACPAGRGTGGREEGGESAP